MGWIFLGLIVAAVFFAISIYNRLVAGRNRFKNAFAQIDVQLQRRYDLIPNLVETAKGYMKHESETLEAVIKARQTCVDLKNAEKIGELMKAEGFLTQAMSRLMMVSENYPDLKADQSMMKVQEELTSTENKIGFARQAYNDAATRYNNKREVFPANLISGGFEEAELFEIVDAGERSVPEVKF